MANRALQYFSYSKEHENMILIMDMYAKMQLRGFKPQKLQVALSSWHKKWIHTREQIYEMCAETLQIPRHLANEIRENKQIYHPRPRDRDRIVGCILWIFEQIRKRPEDEQMVITMRMKGVSFKKILYINPTLKSSIDKRCYQQFLIEIFDSEQMEYLREVLPKTKKREAA